MAPEDNAPGAGVGLDLEEAGLVEDARAIEIILNRERDSRWFDWFLAKRDEVYTHGPSAKHQSSTVERNYKPCATKCAPPPYFIAITVNCLQLSGTFY